MFKKSRMSVVATLMATSVVLAFASLAQASSSCQGHCGGDAGACWCDDLCTSLGDCCSDYEQVCGDSVSIPSGFAEIMDGIGVTLYRKNYSGGYPDYVQVLYLGQGATVGFSNGHESNDQFQRRSLEQIWSQSLVSSPASFCVTNGQFFNNDSSHQYYTPLSFPVKSDGEVITENIDWRHAGKMRMLEIWNDHAAIRGFNGINDVYSSSAPNIIVGLTKDAVVGDGRRKGRTFVGVLGNDKILVFNSYYSYKLEAAQVLQNFGVDPDKIMMLDGGGSTQLICAGNGYIPSSRSIPQALVTIEGDSSSQPGDVCGSGKVYDCVMNCISSSTAYAWIGDGYCDDGSYLGIVLTCPAFDNDGGDCD